MAAPKKYTVRHRLLVFTKFPLWPVIQEWRESELELEFMKASDIDN
jgi:hypothetical protein